MLAAGIDGITNGIASLSSFSESDLLINRSSGYNMTEKYYLPALMLTIPVTLAQDILSQPRNAGLRCTCNYCQGAMSNLARNAKLHFLETRMNEIRQLNSLDSTSERVSWFIRNVRQAYQSCEEIRRQQAIAFNASYYSHLRVWATVFGQ